MPEKKGFPLGWLLLFLVFLGCVPLVWKANQLLGEVRHRACLSNLRTLRGYVELYDRDHKIPMKKFDMEILIKEGYLKVPLECSGKNLFSPRGDYRFSPGGLVGCTVHGDEYTSPID